VSTVRAHRDSRLRAKRALARGPWSLEPTGQPTASDLYGLLPDLTLSPHVGLGEGIA
jgi:hypothetical protein